MLQSYVSPSFCHAPQYLSGGASVACRRRFMTNNFRRNFGRVPFKLIVGHCDGYAQPLHRGRVPNDVTLPRGKTAETNAAKSASRFGKINWRECTAARF